MISKVAKAVGFIGGVAAVVWAMRDRFISVAVSREPEPPAFRATPAQPASTPASASTGVLESIDGIGPIYAKRLAAAGFSTKEQLADRGAESVAAAAKVSPSRAQEWIDQVRPGR